MSGMKMEKLDAFVTSAMAEVANIISGNAATYFAKNGFSCNIAPPQIIVGESGTVAMTAEQGIVLPLKTDVGTLEITVSLHKA
jgi:chemotaxis protein CheX